MESASNRARVLRKIQSDYYRLSHCGERKALSVLTARLVWLKAMALRCAWRSETAVQSKCALGDPERKQQIHSFCLNTNLAFTSTYSGISTPI